MARKEIKKGNLIQINGIDFVVGFAEELKYQKGTFSLGVSKLHGKKIFSCYYFANKGSFSKLISMDF